MQKSLFFIFFLCAALTAYGEWVVVQQDGKAAVARHWQPHLRPARARNHGALLRKGSPRERVLKNNELGRS